MRKKGVDDRDGIFQANAAQRGAVAGVIIGLILVLMIRVTSLTFDFVMPALLVAALPLFLALIGAWLSSYNRW